MNLAFCYESVLPRRGGCETYIADLARRLVADRHEVHLYACRWDAAALPPGLHYHALPAPHGPRFLRPWRFGGRVAEALRGARHDVTIGFDKTWGQDVLYPQGGLHSASAAHNIDKHGSAWQRGLARVVKALDLAHWSYRRLERRQYLGPRRPLVVVNSEMVRRHFMQYLGYDADDVHVVRSAIDPQRFAEQDRPRRRAEWREILGFGAHETIAVFAAMNYRLKGLVPLLYAVRRLCEHPEFAEAAKTFRVLVAGGLDYGRYQRLAQRLGVGEKFYFVGPCPDMRNSYFAADFLVHPTFYDPCSLVVLEALTCGLPVVTTRRNGASELLQPPREGYVVDDPHDHERLAWCLGQLLDPARRAACAQAARRAGQQWTFEHHYRELLRVFEAATRRKQAA
jgi:UDP-glucose:(heptosyl)LPS alpha-1,3-glucosyltransferase